MHPATSRAFVECVRTGHHRGPSDKICSALHIERRCASLGLPRSRPRLTAWGTRSLLGCLLLVAPLHAQQPGAARTEIGSCASPPANPLLGGITLSAAGGDGDPNLCSLVEAWWRWHLSGYLRLASGAAPAADSLFNLVDVAFAIYRPTLAAEVVIRADSVRRENGMKTVGLLYLTAVDRALGSTERPESLRWRVRVNTNAAASRDYAFAVAMGPTVALESPVDGVRLHAIASHADSARLDVVRSQFRDLVAARQAFGRGATPFDLNVLLGATQDTMLGWLGVQHATRPAYAFTIYAPPLLLSPITKSGGVDPHELGHLIHPRASAQRLNSLADEAFATAIGGAFGHSLATEICDAYREGDTTTVGVTSQAATKRKALLLLARAMHDALRSGADSIRFFDEGRWTRAGAEWRDLGTLLGVPADSLFDAARRNLRSEVAGCPPTRPPGKRPP